MDPTTLERLSDQTRSLVGTTLSPLVQLFYWLVLLDLLLENGTPSPVYYEDALQEIERLLGRADMDLHDPLLFRDVNRLAFHAGLPRSEAIRDAQSGIQMQLEHPQSRQILTPPDSSRLRVPILLALPGMALWGRTPELAVSAPLAVQASRNVREPGRIIWHNERAEADPIITAGERALHAALHALGTQRPLLSYEIQIEKSGLILRGDSLGLGLALLFHAYEAAERRRPHRLPPPDTAVVGSVDAKGLVASASAVSLAAKLRAAAGAGFRRVILPEANLDDGEAELQRIRKQLPGNLDLQLVPVRDLAEILDHTDLLARPTMPVRRRIHRPRAIRIGIWSVLVVLAVALALEYRPRDWNFRNTESVLSSTDRSQVVLRQSGFPPRERRWQFDSPLSTADVVDLAPRTHSALLVGTDLTGPHPGTLYCYDFSTRHLLWSRSFTDAPGLPDYTMTSVSFRVKEVITTDLDGDGRKDIVCSVHASPMSPCYVYWLTDDGRVRAMYVHRGYLFGMTAADLEMDGRTEIFLRGTSHSDSGPYKQRATLVVLDKDHFSGWPSGGPFVGSTEAPFDSCLARLIFPPIPEYCKIMSIPGPSVTKFWVHSTSERPAVIVTVAAPDRPGLMVTLNRDFRPVRVVAEDDLIPLVEKALDNGEIHRDFTTPSALAEYLDEIQRLP